MAIRSIMLCVVLFTSAAAAQEFSWPRTFERTGHEISIHQPQVVEWAARETLTFRAAIVISPSGSERVAFGAMTCRASTSIDLDDFEVVISDVRLVELTMEGVHERVIPLLRDLLVSLLDPNRRIHVSLDRLLPAAPRVMPALDGVSKEPPPIHVRSGPAILVGFVGEPVFESTGSSGIESATNTNWSLLRDPATSMLYLLDGQAWFATDDLGAEAWANVAAPADALIRMPADGAWNDVLLAIPGRETAPPDVIVTVEPAELVLTAGPPTLTTISGTTLSYVDNTISPLFHCAARETWYLLLSGRWFETPSLDGTWRAVTDLPPDFAAIPDDHVRADVLISVPGTPEAMEAAILASIPHRATLRQTRLKIEVTYGGEPNFEPVDGADGIDAATNTDDVVLRINGRFYCCRDAVWMLATRPTGPWIPCLHLPHEIDTIPASSPYHFVTYADIDGHDTDTVSVRCTAGYRGELVSGGVVVFGAGAWHPDASRASDARFQTYGSRARYSMALGGYRSGAIAYGPGHRVSASPRYDMITSRWREGAYDPTPRGAPRIASPFAAWKSAFVSATDRSGVEVVWTLGDDDVEPGDLYAGADGKVYRRLDDGGWQVRDGETWADVAPSSAPDERVPEPTGITRDEVAAILDDDAATRLRGELRHAAQYSNARRAASEQADLDAQNR